VKRTPVTDAVWGELPRLGIRWTRNPAGKHARIVFTWRGKETFVGVSLSPHNAIFAPVKALADMRRQLGIRPPTKARSRDRRERDTCRVEPDALAGITPGGDGLAALSAHPMARKPRGYLGRFWFGEGAA